MNDLNKYGILIADIVKELFILLLALCILINFSIKIKEKKNDNKNILYLNLAEDCSGVTGSIKDKFLKILSCHVNNGLIDISQNFDILDNTNTLYAVFISSMYIFIGLISKINVNHKHSWRNVFNDFINKSTYILLFPFFIITTLTFLYVAYYIIHTILNKIGIINKTHYIIALLIYLIFIYGYVLFFIIFIIYSIIFIYSRDNIQYIVNANRFKNNNKGKNEFINKYKDAKYNGIFNSGVITKGELGNLYDECISEGKNSYFSIVRTIYNIIGGLVEHHKILNNNVETSRLMPYIILNYFILFLFCVFIFGLTVGGVFKIIGFSIYNTIGFLFNYDKIFHKLYCPDIEIKKIYFALKIIIALLIVYNIYKLFSTIYFAFAVVVFIIMIRLLLKNYNLELNYSCNNNE